MPRDVSFYPVGWEETCGGVGRPQELINEDLRQCDYAVFVLHDRWGTPTGSDHTSGTEEEWTIAEQLYEESKIRNIALFFKTVDARQQRDPGPQLQRVLEFKKSIETGRRYLFKTYATAEDFVDLLEGNLAHWLMKHEEQEKSLQLTGLVTLTAARTETSETPESLPSIAPGFEYWIGQAETLLAEAVPDHHGALFASSLSGVGSCLTIG